MLDAAVAAAAAAAAGSASADQRRERQHEEGAQVEGLKPGVTRLCGGMGSSGCCLSPEMCGTRRRRGRIMAAVCVMGNRRRGLVR